MEVPTLGNAYMLEDLFTQRKPEPAAATGANISRSERPKETKEQRIAREKEQLQTRLASADLDDTRTRVAYVLNQYPTCRNSDSELIIRYWKHFDGDYLYSDGISFDAFRRVTPVSSIVRARATIQNTYKLFKPDEAVSGLRGELEQKVRKRQRAASSAAMPFVHVYSDESGKTDRHYIVGSVWVNDVDVQLLGLQRRLNAWRKQKDWSSEIHFVDIKGHTKTDYIDFFQQAMQSSEYIGFKATILAREDVKKRPTEDAIYSLYYRLAVEGIRHEVESKRFELPRNLMLWKDEDEGSDKLHLLTLRDRMQVECPKQFDNQLNVMGVEAMPSATNVLMMLADVFTGAVNRVVNREPNANRGHKDDVAEAVLSMLGLSPSEPLTDVRRDFVRIIKL
jgi:uncharacterized protein (DUF2267 family)